MSGISVEGQRRRMTASIPRVAAIAAVLAALSGCAEVKPYDIRSVYRASPVGLPAISMKHSTADIEEALANRSSSFSDYGIGLRYWDGDAITAANGDRVIQVAASQNALSYHDASRYNAGQVLRVMCEYKLECQSLPDGGTRVVARMTRMQAPDRYETRFSIHALGFVGWEPHRDVAATGREEMAFLQALQAVVHEAVSRREMLQRLESRSKP